jgi:HSP20 family protein
LFVDCNDRDRNDTNDVDCQCPGFSFGGPFPCKAYFCPQHNKRELEPEAKATAGERESKTNQNTNEPRTAPLVQAPPFFEHPNPWAGAYGGYQNRGGRGFYPDQRSQYGIGPANWSGPWGNFGPSIGFRPWGSLGPWGNFGPWRGRGNPRFTGSFGPMNNIMGRWGQFGAMNYFGYDETAAKDEAEPEFNIFETPMSFSVCISLFGANKAGLKVDLDLRKCELNIKGTIQRRGNRSSFKELGQNDKAEFEHKLYLGNRVDRSQIQIDGITARMEDGILIVSIPKLNSEHVEIKKVHIE